MRHSSIFALIAALIALPAVVFAQTSGQADPAYASNAPISGLHNVEVSPEPDDELGIGTQIPFEAVPPYPDVSFREGRKPRSKDDLALLREWLESVGPVDGMRILVGRTVGVRFESHVESIDWRFAIEYERTLLELKGAIRYKF